jgi:hypothetical protein
MGAAWPPSGPTMSLIHGSCSRANHKPPFKSVWSTNKIYSQWIHGPIVIHLELSTDLPTDFMPEFWHVLPLQLPLGANQCCRIVRRWNGGPSDAFPRSPGTQVTPLTSLLPTSTPMPLYTINRGCGAQWKDAPFISKLSKLLLAFQLSISYRVVV